MTQSVPIGMSVTLDQNVTYALPAKPVYVNSNQAVQTSLDGTTWNAYTAGSVSSGKFIRSTLVGTVVSLSEAGKAAGSGTVSGSGSFQDFIAVGANPAQSGHIRLPDAGAIKNRNINGASDMSVLTAYTSVIVLGEGQPVSMYGPLSLGLTPAQGGMVRLPNGQAIAWRNNANTADIIGIVVIANDNLQINAGGALVFQTNAISRWYIDSSNLAPLTNDLASIGTAALKVKNIFVSGAIMTGIKAGAPVDADVTNPTDGMIRIDSTNSKIWVRIGGVWKGALLT